MQLITQASLQNVHQAAQYLLGCEIWRTTPAGIIKARIVETERYHQDDPASHTYGGPSPRNVAMFGPAAHAYIYFTYGMHWCFNITAGPTSYGAGVLIRAVEPLENMHIMQQNRSFRAQSATSGKILHNISNGPAKLAQALGIDRELYGHDLRKPPLQVFEPNNRDFEVVKTTRIGISKAADEIARFYIKDNPFVSKK